MLGNVKLGFDCPDDAPGDLVLEREEVSEFDVVALRPDLPAGRSIRQLRADAKTLTGAPDAPVQHVTHAEGLSDLPNVERLAAKVKGRIAGRDEEPAQARKTRDDVLGETVGEMLLLDVLT